MIIGFHWNGDGDGDDDGDDNDDDNDDDDARVEKQCRWQQTPGPGL